MTQPNIILILMDDLGWRDLSAYGSTFYETPNLDRFAGQSVCFSDAYAACPVCSPTRASIMSGKYPATVGITDWIDWGKHLHPARGKLIDVPYLDHLPLEETALPEALGAAGYATWHVGKWHLGGEGHTPDRHGFDLNIGGSDKGMPWHGYFSPWDLPHLENAPEGTYLIDHLTDQAIALIQECPADRPFFLNLWYYAVHTPIQAKLDKVPKYEAKARALGLDQIEPFEEGDFFPCEHKKDRRIRRRRLQSDPAYAAMIESVDENIGRLLHALEETGQADNTMMVFFSDNGGLATSEGSPTCNAPLAEGKGWMYEGGTREPLIVRWPGVAQPGTWCDAPVTSPDLYPTLLQAAGLPLMPKQHVDGVSLLPLLAGTGDLDREAIYWHYPHYGNQGGTPGSSIRAGGWKLIEFFEDGRLELYNLREDIGETHNLAAEHPALTGKLSGMLTAWRDRVEAKIPQPNPDYVPWQ